jgi:hypothetical protein
MNSAATKPIMPVIMDRYQAGPDLEASLCGACRHQLGKSRFAPVRNVTRLGAG